MNATLTPPEVTEIKVDLLLAGGQTYTHFFKLDDPILRNLLTIITARASGLASATPCLFQIPQNQGRSTLFFSSEHLIAILTEPPLVVQPPPPTSTLPSSFLQLENFLSEEEHQHLIKFVMQQKSNFVSSSTSTSDLNYRRSSVLSVFPEFSALILKKIEAVLPQVREKYALPPFPVAQIESQLTAHNDSNFYKVHNDNGSPDTATRILSYVYYFYREPKGFEGGELRIYDSKIENNIYVQAESYQTVEPLNNSIVFFLSRYLHEVMPVKCASKSFADSRFTINGWVREVKQ